ncbi:MAG: DUF4489 domain-containing protein [Clostridium butyricum]|nr:DUF4489 domain-containing protein [Clostridium butyricum]
MNILSDDETFDGRSGLRRACGRDSYNNDSYNNDCSDQGGKSILKCGSANAGPLPILGTQGLIPTLPIPVGSVSIDTCKLCNPTILVTANLLINTPVSLLSSLTFRIVRCLDGCSQPVGGSFTFSDAIEALSSSSFTFSFCDCSSCKGCATYSIEVTSATLLQAGTTISGTISALAVENLC